MRQPVRALSSAPRLPLPLLPRRHQLLLSRPLLPSVSKKPAAVRRPIAMKLMIMATTTTTMAMGGEDDDDGDGATGDGTMGDGTMGDDNGDDDGDG